MFETRKQREEKVKSILTQAAAEKDAEKKKLILAEAQKVIAATKAADAAEQKAAQGPHYPVDATAAFNGNSATITEAHQDARGEWQFTVDLSGTPLGIYDGPHETSETDLRQQLGEQLGQPLAPGQWYAPGMSISCRGRGGLVEQVAKAVDGQFIYLVRGLPTPVSQLEFLAFLVGL